MNLWLGLLIGLKEIWAHKFRSFLTMLGARFPGVQFMVTGVLGPESNAHGPNEFLHLPAARKLTAALVYILRHMKDR